MAIRGEERRPLLNEEQMERYSRQIILEDVGVAGQRRLLAARVLIVGAGGLGSPAAIYLAAAGVGTLGIVDGDRVDLTNLHRQPLHFTHDVGRPKTQSARRTLEDINPDVEVQTFQVPLTSENALDIIRDYGVVINGSDNFPTRYLVNDACVMLGTPLVDASILKWEGQATVFMPGQGCYRCLFPTPPPPGAVPTCAEGGIVGALAGHMGTLQAIEAVKIILGAGTTLAGRLLIVDALEGESRTVRYRRNPDCPVCGDRPTIAALIDYEEFCGVPGARVERHEDLRAPAISTAEAHALLAEGRAQLVDVREPWENAQVRIPGALLVPMGEVLDRLDQFDRARTVVVHCATGVRSGEVVEHLTAQGWRNVRNLHGGIVAWMNERLPVEP